MIFICTFDPFRQGRHIYTFKNICCEDNNLELNDGAVTIFLNAKGKLDDISPELKVFLDLIIGRTSNDPFVKEIETRIESVVQEAEWRRRLMMMSIHDQGKFLEGFDMGVEITKNDMAVDMKREGLPLDMIARILKESVSVIQGWLDEAKV